MLYRAGYVVVKFRFDEFRPAKTLIRSLIDGVRTPTGVGCGDSVDTDAASSVGTVRMDNTGDALRRGVDTAGNIVVVVTVVAGVGGIDGGPVVVKVGGTVIVVVVFVVGFENEIGATMAGGPSRGSATTA